MVNRSRGWSPSRTFVGTLIGIGGFMVVPTGIDHPSEIYLIMRLMLYAGLGMAVGAIADARKARRGRDEA